MINFADGQTYLDLFRLSVTGAVLFALGTVVVRLVRLAMLDPSSSSVSRRPWVPPCPSDKVKLPLAMIHQQSLHAILLMAIPFIPACNLFFPTGFVIAERILYLPSMGFLLLVGIGVQRLHTNHTNQASPSTRIPANKPPTRKAIIELILCSVIVAFSLKTFLRSQEWQVQHPLVSLSHNYDSCSHRQTEYKLFSSSLLVNPNNTKLLNNLGRILEKSNQNHVALDYFERAINIEPKDIRSHLNLANLHLKMNKSEHAEAIYRNAIKQIEDEFANSGTARQHNQPIQQGNKSGVSPLYFTALIRLAELIGNDANKTEDLKLINQKLRTFNTNIANHSKQTGNGRTSCEGNCKLEFDYASAMELNNLYNVSSMQ